MQETPQQICQSKDSQPYFCAESFSEGRDLGPIFHQCHHLYPFYYNCSLIGTGIRVVIPSMCHQFFSIYWHSWLPSTWLHVLGGAGWRCLLPLPNFHLKGCSYTHVSYVPSPHIEKFGPIMVTSLTIVSIVALTPCIMLISITIPYMYQLPRVVGCSSLWPLHCHSQLCDFLSQIHDVVLPL